MSKQYVTCVLLRHAVRDIMTRAIPRHDRIINVSIHYFQQAVPDRLQQASQSLTSGNVMFVTKNYPVNAAWKVITLGCIKKSKRH